MSDCRLETGSLESPWWLPGGDTGHPPLAGAGRAGRAGGAGRLDWRRGQVEEMKEWIEGMDGFK